MRLQKFVLGICAGVVAILLVRCGNSTSPTTGSPTPTPTPSNPNPTRFKKRVLVSVTSPSGGAVLIADGQNDVLARQAVGVTNPGKMVTAGGETAILNTTLSEITIFNNPGEVVFFTTPMQAQPFDIAITSDGKTAFAAVKNKGVVEAVNTATGNLTATISVPTPARLVMSPNGTKLLVFSDDPQTIPGTNKNAFFVIDVATAASNPVATAIPGPGLDQPYSGVFNGSETKAFILNCGPECGGTTASVVPVDFSGSTPVFGTAIPVPGATVGLLSGSNLFVAGTPATPPAGCNFAACGTISVINTGSSVASSPVPITDGLHQVMAMSAANHLYIGARDCTVGPSGQSQVQSCLSIFNTTTNATTGPLLESALRTNFNVTGLQQISGRNVLYVVQGGALDIFDTTTDNVSTSVQPVNISGTAIDVLQIDP